MNHLLSYDVLILEANFYDVQWKFILSTDRLAMSGDAFFGKDGGSRNSHKMRQSDMPGMGVLIYPSLRNYTANIGI